MEILQRFISVSKAMKISVIITNGHLSKPKPLLLKKLTFFQMKLFSTCICNQFITVSGPAETILSQMHKPIINWFRMILKSYIVGLYGHPSSHNWYLYVGCSVCVWFYRFFGHSTIISSGKWSWHMIITFPRYTGVKIVLHRDHCSPIDLQTDHWPNFIWAPETEGTT